VDWYPWGEEALGRGGNEDKPIFLSIGYAACRWCHVMAHESFEDPENAAYMNQHFINIKVAARSARTWTACTSPLCRHLSSFFRVVLIDMVQRPLEFHSWCLAAL
jgi:hypothetical protein